MIDDYTQAMTLVEEMKQYLPTPVLPTKSLLRFLRKNEIQISKRDKILVDSIFYSGDEGGIMCALALSQNQDAAVVVSVTHLKVKKTHPLAKEIKAYQTKRVKRLSQYR